LTRGGVSTHETAEFVKILNNTLVDIADSIGIFTRSVNTEIVGNTVINPGLEGIFCSNRGQLGNIRVSLNTIKLGTTSSDGIFVVSQPNTPGTLVSIFRMVEVTSNQIEGGRDGVTIESRTGVTLRSSVVTGNNLFGFTRDAIVLHANGANILGVTLNGNYMFGGSGAVSAIHLLATTGAVNEVIISGNATVASGTPVLADGPAISTGRTVVTGNVLRGTSPQIVGIANEFGNILTT
jgi:hypothetical protein